MPVTNIKVNLTYYNACIHQRILILHACNPVLLGQAKVKQVPLDVA